MGRISLNLKSGQKVTWPNKCAICNANSSDWANAHLSKVTSLKYYTVAFGWTTQTQTISYPVCIKHKLLCSFLGKPSQWTFTDTLLYLILIPAGSLMLFVCPLALLSEFTNLNIGAFWIYLAFYISGLSFLFIAIWLIISSVYNPVKIIDAKEKSIRLFFKNKEFLQKFKNLNKNIILNNDEQG